MKLTEGALALAYPWPTGDIRRRASGERQVSAVRAIPGRIVSDTREGTKRVMTFSNLTAGIRRLRISTPDRKPLLVVVDTLETDASEPQLQLRQLQGTIEQQGDSLQVLADAERRCRARQATAEGMVSWPRDTIMWDFRADAQRGGPGGPAVHLAGVPGDDGARERSWRTRTAGGVPTTRSRTCC